MKHERKIKLTKKQYLIGLFIIILLVIVSFFKLGLNLYVDWLWFTAVGYTKVFTTALLSNLAVRVSVAVWLFIFFFINLIFTKREILKQKHNITNDNIIPLKEALISKILSPKRLTIFYIVASFLLAFMFSSVGANQWLIVQKYLHRQSFGVVDPLFGKDVGFYVFSLPFFEFIYSLLMLSSIIGIILVAALYFLADPRQFQRGGGVTRAKLHVSLLVAFILILQAANYWFSTYNLLQSSRGVAYGASYTDVHAQLPALKILMVIAIISAVLVIVNVFLRKMRWVVGSIILLVASSIVLGGIFPGFVQKFIVDPDEFTKEEPYLQHNIDFTRKAFDLDTIDSQPFAVDGQLTQGNLEINNGTISNVRLWDWRPLIQTFSQLQEITLYYNFANVDIDRYMVDGQLKQVMLSARELNQDQLPQQAKTWINEKLRYTHGYGLVMSPVSSVSEQGLPDFYVKDLPPKSTVSGVDVTRPAIYFGEQTNDYVFVRANTNEFDYPSGNGENVETTYKEDSGISVGSMLRRLLMAVYFQDYKILLANEFNKDTRLLMRRNIKERISRIMPYLTYDRDPYIVTADGRMFWIQDAYTTSSSYPYSQNINGINYIRNSVKVVIDAYSGAVNFYVSDTGDPIIKVFADIFPDTFKPLKQMPEYLQGHIRYPVDMFSLQAQQYQSYHMTNTRNFYNKEDLWNIPSEIIGSDAEVMEPYYVIMTLPEKNEPEYLLMLPFTPAKKQNMSAWLAVKNSKEEYGDMVNFAFPRNELVFGPMQIEARIDQDSEISSQLSLWNQRGSQVIRGNLIVLPISNSLLYIEPIFLQGEQSKLPELRRVIVSYQNNIAMERTLGEALAKLFGEGQAAPPEEPQQPDADPSDEPVIEDLATLINKANQEYNKAQEALQQGDWAGYGQAINNLEEILQQLQSSTTQQ